MLSPPLIWTSHRPGWTYLPGLTVCTSGSEHTLRPPSTAARVRDHGPDHTCMFARVSVHRLAGPVLAASIPRCYVFVGRSQVAPNGLYVQHDLAGSERRLARMLTGVLLLLRYVRSDSLLRIAESGPEGLSWTCSIFLACREAKL